MAYLVSLGTLMERVLQRCNLEGRSAFIKPPELADTINGSIAEWVDEVRGTTWGSTYARSKRTFPTESGRQTYPLPFDFLTALSVDVLIASGAQPICARAYQEEERNAYVGLSLAYGPTVVPVYQIQGSDIALLPVPLGAYTVTLNYVPGAPKLEDAEDTIDSINGWEEFIVLDAAIKCLLKSGEHERIPFLSQRLEQQRQRIRALAPRRDQQTAERVHVVQNAGYGWEDW